MKTLKISDELHKQLKIYAAENSINIVNFVNLAISREMGLCKAPTKKIKSRKSK